MILQANRAIKLARELNRAPRKEDLEFVIEGPKLIEEAIKANLLIGYILTTEKAWDKVKGNFNRLKTLFVSEKIFKSITDTETPQGILAIAKKPVCSLFELLKKPNKMLIVLNDISDPGNLGTIIRTAYSFNVDGIIITENSVNPYSPKVVRGSAGAIFHIPTGEGSNLIQIIKKLKSLNYFILMADANAGRSLTNIEVKKPLAFFLGNEAHGFEKSDLDLAHLILKIPGKFESLNVGVACGIILYKLLSGDERTV